MKKKILLGCGIPILLAGIIGIFAARALKPKPKTERSEIVQRGNVEIKVVETGTIEALRKVEIKSKVGGRVLKLLVDEGDVVQKGQALAFIDPQEINTQIDALRAQLSGAVARLASARKGTQFQEAQTGAGITQFAQAVQASKARLRMSQADSQSQPEITQRSIEIAQANLEAAQANLKVQNDNYTLLVESTHPQNVVNTQSAYDRAKAQNENAERNLQRQKQLLEKGFVSQQIVDNAEVDLRLADAQQREAKQRLDRINQTNALEAANAKSQIANARSQVRQQEAAVAQAKASVSPVMKQREVESARAALAQAEAQYVSALSNKTQDKMRGDDAMAAEAQVRQIKSQLDEFLVRQNDTTLVASMSGVVTKRYVEAGEIVTSAVSSFSSGTPIFQISDLAVMLVKINVNEVDIAKLKRGLLTEVTLDASKGTTFLGKVRKVSPASLTAATTGDGGSRSGSSGGQAVVRFLIEIQIDRADPRLKPGMSARCAAIVSRHKNVLRIPLNCVVLKEGDKGTVQIVTSTTKDGQTAETASSRDVTVGLRGDDFIEVVSGLKEGEKVRPAEFTGPVRKTIDINGP